VALTLAVTAAAQERPGADVLNLPPGATVLEGLPDVRVDATELTVTRRELDAVEAATERLRVRVQDGRLYSSDGSPLSVSESGGFTYLRSSTHPGRYVRLRRLDDRLLYVQHIDMGEYSVTYWGELRVVLGR
jgi:hypothetical protein